MAVKKTDQQLKCTLKIVNNHVWTDHSLVSGVQSSAKRKKKLIKKHLHFQYKTKNGKRCVECPYSVPLVIMKTGWLFRCNGISLYTPMSSLHSVFLQHRSQFTIALFYKRS